MQELEVRILREWDMPVWEAPDKPVIYRQILYQIPPWPPRQIQIPKALATEEAIAAAIKADHAAARPDTGRSIKIPID